MKLHETVVIRCDDIGARCGDIGARYGDICVWGSDVGDRAEVIRCDDIGAGCGDVVARCGDDGARRGDCAELPAISAQSLRRLRSWYSTFSKPASGGPTTVNCHHQQPERNGYFHGPLWNLSSRNRVTPVCIQNGVSHGTTFAAISTIPAALSRSLRRSAAARSPMR